MIHPWSNRLPDSRYRRIVKAVSSGAAARLLTVAVSLFTLPLAVRYLGAQRYGVWVTITTTAVWINLLDLGIANTLTNEISRAYALNDKASARRYFTNALGVTALAAASVGLLFVCLLRHVNWVKVFNVGKDVTATEVERTVHSGCRADTAGLAVQLSQQAARWISGTPSELGCFRRGSPSQPGGTRSRHRPARSHADAVPDVAGNYHACQPDDDAHCSLAEAVAAPEIFSRRPALDKATV